MFVLGEEVKLHFCSHDCFRQFTFPAGPERPSFLHCPKCKRWVRRQPQHTRHDVQGTYQGMEVCVDCFEETTLSLGQPYVYDPETHAVQAFLFQSHCKHDKWVRHGYIPHPDLAPTTIARAPKWEVFIDSDYLLDVSRAVSETHRWVTWFLATGCLDVGDHVPMTLYVRPRPYHREARDAALAFLMFAPRCGLPHEVAEVIAKLVYHSSCESVWCERVNWQ